MNTMQTMNDEALAAVAHALAHPARVRILRLLAGQTECRGVDLFSELPLAQSTVSEHLRVLKEAGIVSSRPVGTAAVYCIVPEAFEELRTLLSGVSRDLPTCSPETGECR
jgi:ArsR family transcriptional regulator